MRSTLVISSVLLLLSFTFGEDTTYPQDYFTSPVAGPLRLSGTFGELRPGHFHAGADIKGKVGDELLAAAEGYASRVSVSPGGYGKVLYLSHPNGYTTVYAHLDRFSPAIEAYVRSHQHAEESYAVDLRPEPGRFSFKKGRTIGRMGLTGRSFGPHLHFEVRDSSGALVVNPLHFGLPVADRRAPTMQGLRLYAIDERGGASLIREEKLRPGKGGSFSLASTDTLFTHAPRMALGIETFDRQDGAANRNGIYSLKLFYDDSLANYFNMAQFRREETRYLNAHLDHEALWEEGRYINRCYRMPGNALSNYAGGEGVLALAPGEAVKVSLQAADHAGNRSELAFWLKRVSGAQEAVRPLYNYLLPYDEASTIQAPGLLLHFPEKSFYEDMYLHYFPVLEDSYGVYSLAHHLHQPGTPVHHSFEIGIRPTLLIPDRLMDKAFIAYCGTGEAVVNCGGQWKEGFLQARVRALGTYCILTDEAPPTITPLNWRENRSLGASVAFRIEDNIDTAGNVPGLSYRGTIDGRWVLFEYDAKRNRLEHFFEDTLAHGTHQLRLEVKDALGNTSVFEQPFHR